MEPGKGFAGGAYAFGLPCKQLCIWSLDTRSLSGNFNGLCSDTQPFYYRNVLVSLPPAGKKQRKMVIAVLFLDLSFLDISNLTPREPIYVPVGECHMCIFLCDP